MVIVAGLAILATVVAFAMFVVTDIRGQAHDHRLDELWDDEPPAEGFL